MNFRKKSAAARLLTGVLTLCMILSAAFVGVYSAAAADVPGPADLERPLPAKSDNSPPADASPVMETLELKGTTYCLVRSEAQLRAIGTGEYGMDQNYMQQADIQLSAEEWTPIGTWDDPFTGSFNGNGFEIVGLTMTDPDAKVIGLFGVAEKAHIYNVTLRDYDITSAGGNVQGKSVGAILAVGQGSRSYDNAAYPKEADVGQTAVGQPAGIDRYYEAGSLPLFEIAFSRLDKSAQQTWLEKLYAGDDFAFFSAAVRGLDAGSSLLAGFAEKAYTDGEIAFFSTLSDGMGETELESWLDRALEDGKWNFQSMLFNKLDRNDEFDERIEAQEKEWAEAQRAEYRAAGVTMDGKNYYYRGKLVNIFLDVRKNGSFYVLDMNPKGTVNIKIIRDAGGKVTGAAYMTDAEAAGLLADMEEDDDDWQEASGGGDWHVIPVDLESVADKEIVWLGEYTLSEGDRIWYDVSAETGAGLQVGFARPEDKRLDTAYYSVKNLRQKDKDLRCAVSFTFGPPAEPGTYQLFLRAINGALGDVKGSISIGFAADAS